MVVVEEEAEEEEVVVPETERDSEGGGTPRLFKVEFGGERSEGESNGAKTAAKESGGTTVVVVVGVGVEGAEGGGKE